MFKATLSTFIFAVSFVAVTAIPVSERDVGIADGGIVTRTSQENVMEREASPPSTDEVFGTRYGILEREVADTLERKDTDLFFAQKYNRALERRDTDLFFAQKYD
ncbi:hypothetical protein QCA50_004686 [Cerrena zonata]|uniref:RxLR effector protein n=1 Tax=Cerrena zonata TaxID=2478898 RepID=A0AAW0GHM6_9APHY